MQALFKIKTDEPVSSTCPRRDFIDLKTSDVRGKCKSGRAGSLVCVGIKSQVLEDPNAGDASNIPKA